MIKKFWMAILTILCSIGITIAVSYAWFLHDENVDPIAQGYSGSAYFAYGDGVNTPYGINTPRHLYNLAWLCYVDPTNYANKKYEIDEHLQGNLDMTGWVLPPIGTDANPFIGYFNGNGKTIKNLTTSNNIGDFNDSPKPSTVSSISGCDVIGLFGKIAKASNDETATKVQKFYLQNTTVKTATQATCVGIVAGVVDAKIENIGVISSGLNLGTGGHDSTSYSNNASDYTVVGYASENYTTTVANSKTVIYNSTTSYDYFKFKGMGEQTAWGGSMDMKKLFDRIKASTNSGTTNPSGWVDQEIRDYSSEYDYTVVDQTENGTSSNVTKLKTYTAPNGTYLKYYKSNQTNYDLFQSLTALYKTVYSIRIDGNAVTGYKIHDNNDHYLNVVNDSSGSEITTGNNADDATIWYFNNGDLYTYNKSVFSTDIKYFLNGTTNLETELSTTSTTSWSWSDTYSTFTYNYNGKDYYLNCIYVNGSYEFRIASNYVITNGSNHYIKRNGNSIEDTTNINEATVWVYSENGSNPHGILTDITDNTKKLIINGSSLSINNTGTSWSYDGTNIFSGSKVIKYDGSNWVVDTINTYLLQYNGHYLRYNNNNLSDTQTKTDSGTQWELNGTLNNGNWSGTIQLSGQTRYLNYTTSGTRLTTATNNPTTWNRDSYGIYYNDNGTKYYIQYDSGWKASIVYYYISYNGTYLNATTSSVSGSSTPTTKWYVNSNNYVYTVINGRNYYLGANSSLTAKVYTSSTGASYPVKGTVDGYIYLNSYTTWRLNYSGSWNFSNNISTYPTWEINAPFAQIGAYTNYISRCDMVSNNLSKVSVQGCYNYISTSDQAPSVFNYIPINAADASPYNVSTNNTGYIMAGGHESDSNTDIRVSQFDKNYKASSWVSSGSVGWGIETSYNTSNNEWYSNKIYTVGANGCGIIKDTNGSTSGIVYDNTTSSPMFTKFEDSKSQLRQTLEDSGNYVYGLHFMDAQITKNHLVTPDSVKINGVNDGNPISNYTMPEDCIDFHLKSKGVINFFSGYYYSNTTSDDATLRNDTFFSLHEIIRDSDNNITAIYHILEVYLDLENNVYVYHYQNDDNSSDTGYYYLNPNYQEGSLVQKYITVSSSDISNTSRYTKKFDYRWIEDPEGSWTSKPIVWSTHRTCVFYFEIPVNKGEYALGSVSGKNGTYLIYLDIGANASIVDRTEISQETDNVISKYVYVNGIQLLNTQLSAITSINAANSAVAIVTTDDINTITLTRNSDTEITLSQQLNMSYCSNSITTINNGDRAARVIDSTTHKLTATNAQTTTKNKVLKYIDYNNGGIRGVYYESVIENIVTTISGVEGTNNSTTYAVYKIENGTRSLAPDTEYGLLVKESSGSNSGYGVAPSDLTTPTTPSAIITAASFKTGDSNTILRYDFEVLGGYASITDVVEMDYVEISNNSSTYKVNGNSILSGTDKLLIDDYYLQHVYRMSGDTIAISIMAPSGATTSDYNVTVSIVVYEPNKVEASGDNPPGYVFTINGTPIAGTTTTVSITAEAYSS